jgi:Skp family chaperone for outer membrane proteins
VKYLALLSLLALSGDPAVKPLDDKYIAVRKDVWDRVDAADRKLEACEKELQSADGDIKAMDRAIKSYVMATKILKEQKAELKKFGDDMAATARMQREYINSLEEHSYGKDQSFAEQAANVWEWSDGPISFAGGFGLCLATVYALQPAFGSQ